MFSRLLLIAAFAVSSYVSETISISEELENCLNREIPGKSIYIGRNETNETYVKYNFQWNTRKGNILPLGYVIPEVPEDVQGAITCGKELGIKMIPRSGGNSYEKYSFGDSESVIIDLREFNQLHVNYSARTIDVGAGVLMGHLYWALWIAGGFGFAGTSCPSVGVGGATLAGGYGYWSKKFGLLSDNVVEIDIVTADGVLQTVNDQPENNPDLYWALLGGGGGNFGVVTRFRFRFFEVFNFRVNQVYFSYDLNQLPEVFSAWQTWNYNSRNNTGYAQLSVGEGWASVNVIDNNLLNTEIQAIIASFPPSTRDPAISEMNFIDFAAATSYPAVNSSAALGQVTHDFIHRHDYRAKSYYGKKLLSAEEIMEVVQILRRVPRDNLVQLSTFSGETNRIPKEKTAFVHRDSLFMIQVGMYNDSPEAKAWLAEFDKIALEEMESEESYQNYIDEELTTNGQYLRRYYGSNLEKLVEVKNRVDPDDYFSFIQSIPTRLN